MSVRSMTGFGQGVAATETLRFTVEIRGVNHRYADLRFRLPVELAALESELRRRAKGLVRRGRVEFAVRVEHADGSESRPVLNRALLDEVVAAAGTLGARHGLPGRLEVGAVLAVPGMFRAEAAQATPGDAARSATLGAFDEALAAFDAERRREGESLRQELLGRLEAMIAGAAALRERAAALPDQLRTRLVQRLQALGASVELDPVRVAQEAALLAERSDVTEELVRLEGHLEQARSLLARPDAEPVGKRLDFLVQEMNREANTVCSKIPDLELTRRTLALKLDAEKLREQIQNLE